MQVRLDGFENPFRFRLYEFEHSEIHHLFTQQIKKKNCCPSPGPQNP